MKCNNRDIEKLRNYKIVNQKSNQGHQSKFDYCDEYCKLNQRDDHRSIITYHDLDSEYYTWDEENLCYFKPTEIKNQRQLSKTSSTNTHSLAIDGFHIRSHFYSQSKKA